MATDTDQIVVVRTPPEIWGWCATCRRWFFCEGWFDRQAPHPRCPVCLAEPTAIENRGGSGPSEPRR